MVNLDTSLSSIASKTNAAQAELETAMANMDPSDMKSMYEIQTKMTKMNMAMQTMSNLHKALSDTLKSISQNIR